MPMYDPKLIYNIIDGKYALFTRFIFHIGQYGTHLCSRRVHQHHELSYLMLNK
jgi:hypothetical protein